jgi:hypothetical protein
MVAGFHTHIYTKQNNGSSCHCFKWRRERAVGRGEMVD